MVRPIDYWGPLEINNSSSKFEKLKAIYGKTFIMLQLTGKFIYLKTAKILPMVRLELATPGLQNEK